jgi:deoxyadenosine/deoxycytidine kinase
MPAQPKIGIVGPCASGKSTLIRGLAQHGYQAKHIVQEHSYVPGMWQLITNPDILIYLDVSYEESQRRRPMNWTEQDYRIELERLRHARANAHYYLDTDGLSPAEVLAQVLLFLKDTASPVS